MKRILAAILAMLMFLGVFAIGASAADEPEIPSEIESELPFAPSGLSQMIMKALLYLPNLIAPGWADEVIDYLVFFSWLVPAPFNWLLIWFVRAV